MKPALVAVVQVFALIMASSSFTAEKQKLVVYTSMKESLIGKLGDAFVKNNPEIDFSYYSSGAGKIMAKIAAERESGALVFDVLWTSEVPDFYQLKDQGLLERYVSEESKSIISPVRDPEGYFTPARLGTIGIAYNTKAIKEAPKSWHDLLEPQYKGAFGIADPALSGTAYMSIAMIATTFGWDYLSSLKANGAKMGEGSSQVVEDTASGDLKACIGVDYITIEKIEKGASLGLAFPHEMLVIPSPVAIMKGAKNLETARKFVDFLLSKEGQEMIASSGTLPIRSDVRVPAKFGLVAPEDALQRAMKVDYVRMIRERESTIKKFAEIMRGN
jgi:iron(III) transport system substrate-binding protein